MSRVPIDDTLSSELIAEIEASLDDDETINEWVEDAVASRLEKDG